MLRRFSADHDQTNSSILGINYLTSAFFLPPFLGADFSPILKKNNAYIDYANHAARVKIDEEGVEGSAYTIMIASKGMPPDEEVYFTLDRPFLFCVRSDEGIPLFIGVVEKP